MRDDTIWAQATAPGESERAVVRVSGPDAFAVVGAQLDGAVPARRAAVDVRLRIGAHGLPVLLLTMPGPRSFTGEDVAELHVPGSPRLVQRIGMALEASGARPAAPGEFVRRAWEHGRLDLAEVEAVFALIHAESAADASRALRTLRGDVGAELDACRAALLDARALLEAGLDFEAGETGEVDPAAWRGLLERARDRLGALAVQLPRGRRGGGVLLWGAANAGKSSLCNALAGRPAMLVSDRHGTTRDVVGVEVGDGVVLFDAPGDLVDPDAAVDRAALAQRRELGALCAGALWVLDPTVEAAHAPPGVGAPALLAVVATHADLAPLAPLPAAAAGLPVFRVGSPSGLGIPALRAFLARFAGAGGAPGHAEAGRGESIVGAARAAVEAALAGARTGAPPEALALELGDAIDRLDGLRARSVPEELLERIFGRFCLGK
ncbi:MAG: 50S ribosome-binding GTPase [Planctomycetes bacterium]|nr:50S ribosome-binding GTPase [Planctomycetota bacterium]